MTQILRMATGVIAAGLLIIILVLTEVQAGGKTSTGADPSAIQLAQVYVQGAFYAITVIGIAIAVYILTRATRESTQ